MNKINNIIKTLEEMGYDALRNPYGDYLQISLKMRSNYLIVFTLGCDKILSFEDDKQVVILIVRELNRRIKEDL